MLASPALCRPLQGRGLGVDSFHCMSCNACMSLELFNKHRCGEPAAAAAKLAACCSACKCMHAFGVAVHHAPPRCAVCCTCHSECAPWQHAPQGVLRDLIPCACCVTSPPVRWGSHRGRRTVVCILILLPSARPCAVVQWSRAYRATALCAPTASSSRSTQSRHVFLAL